MALAAGTRLGPYEILAPIGAGGMGEVYRANDSRLNRDVAIKVSAERFAERFEREAHAVAALNHPNICSLYDVGPNYLVMELIEGPTLAERIKEGPIPLEEALGIARQIADALGAAHEKGITHRDLKPGNIKIKPDGMVKVLDFGLAKMGGTPTAKGEDSPTISMAATKAGVILGTAAYMSPEQARGKPVDKRADVWAFGVVLYEMLTGQRLFQGEDMTDTLAAVLRKEPEWEHVPLKVRRLLRSCLEKDPKKRLQAIADWELLLVEDIPAASVPAPQPSRLGWVACAVAGVAILALIVAGVGWYRATRPAELKPLVRLDVDLGPDVSLDSQNGAAAILSPDGTRIVYVSQGKLFTRKLDQSKATELTGTDGAFNPFFSPDGKWVAFFTLSKLKKISAEGGVPEVLCDARGARGGSWGEDGTIIAALGIAVGLSRIPSTGGAPTPATELASGEVTHRWPHVLPGGNAMLFTSSTTVTGYEGANIEVMSFKDRRRKTLQRGGSFGRYVATSKQAGHLVYMSNGRLFAVPFSLDTLEVRGTPVPVLEQIAHNPINGSAQVDSSRNSAGPGTLLYRSGGAIGAAQVTVQWLDSTGKTKPLIAKPGPYARPRLSPDGQQLALESTEGRARDVWIYDLQRDSLRRLTFDLGGASVSPVWSPDGKYILFEGKGGIFYIRSDGAGKPQQLTRTKDRQIPWSFTPDGKRLSLHDLSPTGASAIWTVPVESNAPGLEAGKLEVFLQDSFDERSAMFSPDGRWLAYTSNESGAFQVYVRSYPDRGGKYQISNAGGDYPIWSRNGRDLFFRSPDDRIMVASYKIQGDSIVPDQPRVWSQKRLADFANSGIASYDLAPDGKRVAALMPVETPEAQQAENHVIFLENFFDELRRKVPTGN